MHFLAFITFKYFPSCLAGGSENSGNSAGGLGNALNKLTGLLGCKLTIFVTVLLEECYQIVKLLNL